VIPASRIINTSAKPEVKANRKDNDIEFQTVKTLTGSKPVAPDIKYAAPGW
jgi:hypothetical protein